MLTIYEEQQLIQDIEEYFYHNNKLTEPKSILLRQLLTTKQQPIQQLKYLYQPLKNHSQINSKAKLTMLLDCLERLLAEDILSILIQQLMREQQRISLEMMQSLIRFPRILINYRIKVNLQSLYQQVVRVLVNFPYTVQRDVLNTLLMLGEADLILKNPVVLDIVVSNISHLKKSYSLILSALSHKKSDILSRLVKGMSEDFLCRTLLDHILYAETLKPSTSSLIDDVCLSQLSAASVNNIFKQLLFEWANQSFPRVRSPNSQKMISNLLSLIINRVDIKQENVIVAINKGISSRFEYFKQVDFVCQSAVIVMKQYAKALGLDKTGKDSFDVKELNDMYPLNMFGDQLEPDQQHHAQPSKHIENTQFRQQSVQQQVQQVQQSPEVQTTEQEFLIRPKNLYDCYLGILSDLHNRRVSCLKALQPLIRSQCSDLVFVWQNLVSVLLTLKDDQQSINGFMELKTKALVSLIIYRPIDVVQSMSDYFYRDCSLSDKLFVINTLATATRQLSDNPNKYNRINQAEQSQDTFYFKKVTSKYTKSDNHQKDKIQQERSVRLDEKSRRWGHTRIQHKNIKAMGNNSLLPISRQQLMIVDESQPYLNRLYAIIDQIFFRFILPLHSRQKELKDVLFASGILHLLSQFADNIKNYHQKYKIIDEMLDIHNMITTKDIGIERRRLAMLLKISSAVDANLSRQPLVLDKLLNIIRSYQDDKYPWFDPTLKMLVNLLTQNLRNVMANFNRFDGTIVMG